MKLLVKNIGLLVSACRTPRREAFRGAEMSSLPTLNDAWLLADDGRVCDFGGMDSCPVPDAATTLVDAEGGAVFPTFCDSHTHIVYADSREGEFVDKIRGLSYAEIARRGGGILNSADRLHALSEDELFAQARRRVEEVVMKGTGAIEIKSGYGLNTEDELKMLRVVRRLREAYPDLCMRSTFLGAHAVGRARNHPHSPARHVVLPEHALRPCAKDDSERFGRGHSFRLQPWQHAQRRHEVRSRTCMYKDATATCRSHQRRHAEQRRSNGHSRRLRHARRGQGRQLLHHAL